jgi:hypothetical protein
MPARATHIAQSEPSGDMRDAMGISILMIPDVTYKFLSDAAAARNMTVVQLIAEAVTAYVGGEETLKAETEERVPVGAPRLKGFR